MSRSEAGSTLIEILITMVIVAIGILGIAGMQLASARYQQGSITRGSATVNAQAIAERIRANASVLNGATDASSYRAEEAYASATTLPSNPTCGLGGTACTPSESAQRDLREWRQMLAKELPGGRGSIYRVTNLDGTSAPSSRSIIIMWNEKANDSDDSLGAPPTDTNCPTPRVAGVKCLRVNIAI